MSYKDCEEGVRERVYNALNEGKTVTTSQPNIGGNGRVIFEMQRKNMKKDLQLLLAEK